MATRPTNVITRKAGEELVTALIHYTDHAELDRGQLQSARGLRSGYKALLRERDAVGRAREQMHVNALTGRDEPSPREVEHFVERTKQFYRQFYATLSDLNGFVARTHRAYGLGEPPTASMGQFISRWIGKLPEYQQRPGLVSELERARLYRSIFDHAGQKTPFEWDAVRPEPNHVQLARMYGENNRSGNGPEGSSPGGPLGDGGWEFFAPSELSITNGLVSVLESLMPRLLGALPKADQSKVTCPDFPWERHLNGGQPVYSEPESILKPDARLIAVETGEVLKDPELTKAEFRATHASKREQPEVPVFDIPTWMVISADYNFPED